MKTDKMVLKHALLIYGTDEFKAHLPEHLKSIAEQQGSLSDNIELITYYLENKANNIIRQYSRLTYVPIEVIDDILHSEFEGDYSDVLYGHYRDEITRVSRELYDDKINIDEFKHEYGCMLRLQKLYPHLRTAPQENDPNFVLQPLISSTGNEYILK